MSNLLPFALTPASWGLKGPAREEAEAAYNLTGYALDKKLAEIRNRNTDALPYALLRVELNHAMITPLDHDLRVAALDHTGTDLSRASLAIKLRHSDITAYEHDIEVAKLDHPKTDAARKIALLEVELQHAKIDEYAFDLEIAKIDNPDADGLEQAVALLDVERKHHKLDDHNFKKERATLNEEPWIGIIDQGFDPGKGLNGVYFEFDWNEHWIVYLRMNGYTGMSDDQVVDQWFSDVCRSQGVSPMQAISDGTVVPFSGRAKDDA